LKSKFNQSTKDRNKEIFYSTNSIVTRLRFNRIRFQSYLNE